MQDNRKVCIYSRKSKFTGKGESIGNQIDMCKQQLQILNPAITDQDILIYEDEGYSGGNTNRPNFQKMLNDIQANKIKTVICYRLDRISRNVSDFANLKKEFDEYNVSFISLRDNFDTSTPTGNAMMMMVSVFAQLERDTIAERIRDNMQELAKTGRWLGGVTPTGYKSIELVESVTIDGKERKAFKLDIINDEAEIVKLIFDKFIEVQSLTKCEAFLLQNHIHTKNGKKYTRFSLRNILQNPVYMVADEEAFKYFNENGVEIFAEKEQFNGQNAIMSYNKTLQKPGKTNKLKDMSEWIVSIGKHKGLIPSIDWIKVQNLLLQNKSKAYRKPKNSAALLSGLLFCGNCGSYMRPKVYSRLNEKGEKKYSYLCETKEISRMQNCKMKNPSGNELDEAICNHMKKLSNDNSEFNKQLEKAKSAFVVNNDEYYIKLERLKKSLKGNESKIKNLIQSLAAAENQVTTQYVSEEINSLHKENEDITREITEYESLIANQVLSDKEFDVIKNLLSNFNTIFDTMSIEQKRTALKTFIKRIIWDGENVHIFLFGSEDDFSQELISVKTEPIGGNSE